MALIISREARTLIAKHAWSRCNRIAYGFVGGLGNTVSCVLPWRVLNEVREINTTANSPAMLEMAEEMLRPFGLRLIGHYASSGDTYGLDEDYRSAIPEILNRGFSVFINYHPMCCKSCSPTDYYFQSKLLAWEDLAISSGVWLCNAINQRRILQAWNRLLGRHDYL